MEINLPELEKRIRILEQNLQKCELCPRKCRIDRTKGELGYCKSGNKMEIAHIGLHQGEEPNISGTDGSGAIFFMYCNMHCVYCQNWQISHPTNFQNGNEYTPEELAVQIINLQKLGAHNINLVSPTHYLPFILKGLYIAVQGGLNIPLVYNTNGYESVETIKLLNGIVDIYLPDMKYAEDKFASKYSNTSNYVQINLDTIKEMFRQVGILETDKNEIAQKGLIVRHLVLPNNLSQSKKVLDSLASISKYIDISIMSQYSPCYKSIKYNLLNRKITEREYNDIVDYAIKLGFENITCQELKSNENYIPDFNRNKPFNNEL